MSALRRPTVARRFRFGLAAGALAVATFAASRPALAENVMVFAAASLAGSLDEVAEAFTVETGLSVSINYAGTSALARQIEEGAPADIFIAADVDWMDYLAERGLIDPATRTDLLGNRLVLVAPAASAFDPGTDIGPAIVGALGPDARLAMANVNAIPAGRYGEAALEALGVWAEVARFVVQADNVRAALAFVARGETPLGIVYATDAAAEPAVRVVATFAAELHPPILYPAAVTASSDHPDAARFFAFLTGADAAAIFASHGFLPPGPAVE